MSLLTLEALREAGPLLTLAVILIVAMLAGSLARRLHLPGITGQIVAGVIMGKAGFDLFGEEPLHALQPLTHFALGLMAVTVGAHLNVRRLRNAGKRLFYLLLTEATITPLLIFGIFYAIGQTSLTTTVLFSAVAVATAPATTVALVKESRAKGVFVKTLIAAVALNNMACIFLFEVARAYTRPIEEAQGSVLSALVGPTQQLLLAALIGGSLALFLEFLSRLVARMDKLTTAGFIALVLCSGTADVLGVSPLMACLFLGLVQTNTSRQADALVEKVFENFLPAILAVFFTLAGMHLSFEHAQVAGLLALALFIGRAIGKLVAARVAMQLAQATRKVRQNLGFALIPQAGVAVALVILIQDDPDFADIAEIFSAVVLTVVTVNEIVGPILTRFALRRSGETGLDRVRLIEFLQEENIVTEFQPESKEDAIEKLVDFLITSHHLTDVDRDQLLQSVLDRENQASTCLGGGLAVPHGILPDGMNMAGVMALSREGLDFDAPDRLPVHCMVLLGTASEERDRHLQVLATLAQTIGTDAVFQRQIFNAKSPAHASELLHGEQSVDFNTFLGND